MRQTELFCDSHDVNVMYSNDTVFEIAIYRGHPLIRDEVFYWMTQHGRQGEDWGIIDRDPDDGFKGETFQFKTASLALMFKLAWGGK